MDRLEQYDALVLGAPTRYGVMAANLKNVIDQTGPWWNRGAPVDEEGLASTSVATAHGAPPTWGR